MHLNEYGKNSLTLKKHITKFSEESSAQEKIIPLVNRLIKLWIYGKSSDFIKIRRISFYRHLKRIYGYTDVIKKKKIVSKTSKKLSMLDKVGEWCLCEKLFFLW